MVLSELEENAQNACRMRNMMEKNVSVKRISTEFLEGAKNVLRVESTNQYLPLVFPTVHKMKLLLMEDASVKKSTIELTLSALPAPHLTLTFPQFIKNAFRNAHLRKFIQLKATLVFACLASSEKIMNVSCVLKPTFITQKN